MQKHKISSNPHQKIETNPNNKEPKLDIPSKEPKYPPREPSLLK